MITVFIISFAASSSYYIYAKDWLGLKIRFGGSINVFFFSHRIKKQKKIKYKYIIYKEMVSIKYSQNSN